MYSQHDEEADYEMNARFDHVSEAYAATALDPYQEGYCDYCFDAEAHGEKVMDFAEWRATLRTPGNGTHSLTPYSDDDIPF